MKKLIIAMLLITSPAVADETGARPAAAAEPAKPAAVTLTQQELALIVQAEVAHQAAAAAYGKVQAAFAPKK